MNRKYLSSITPFLFQWLFSIIIVLLILTQGFSLQAPANSTLVKELFTGEDRGYLPLGGEFSPYVAILPKTGVFSILLDKPVGDNAQYLAEFSTAQQFLVPRIINQDPIEKIALVYTSNRFIADKRMAEEGYVLVAVLGDGKGLAVKKQ